MIFPSLYSASKPKLFGVPLLKHYPIATQFSTANISGMGGNSARAAAQIMLATVIHSSYKHDKTNQEWRFSSIYWNKDFHSVRLLTFILSPRSEERRK